MKKNIVWQKIKIARAMHNPPLAQTDLLAKLHQENLMISQATLSKIENGDRSVSDSELVAIAKALKVDIVWLLEPLESKDD